MVLLTLAIMLAPHVFWCISVLLHGAVVRIKGDGEALGPSEQFELEGQSF